MHTPLGGPVIPGITFVSHDSIKKSREFIKDLGRLIANIPEGTVLQIHVQVGEPHGMLAPMVSRSWLSSVFCMSDAAMTALIKRNQGKLSPAVYQRVYYKGGKVNYTRVFTLDDVKILQGALLRGPGADKLEDQGFIKGVRRGWLPTKTTPELRAEHQARSNAYFSRLKDSQMYDG